MACILSVSCGGLGQVMRRLRLAGCAGDFIGCAIGSDDAEGASLALELDGAKGPDDTRRVGATVEPGEGTSILCEAEGGRIAVYLDVEGLVGIAVAETAASDMDGSLVMVSPRLVQVEHVLLGLPVACDQTLVVDIFAGFVFDEVVSIVGVDVALGAVGHGEVKENPERGEVEPGHLLYLPDMALMD